MVGEMENDQLTFDGFLSRAVTDSVNARARRSDPETSHEAAASLTQDKMTRLRLLVLDTIQRYGPMHDTDLVEIMRSRFGDHYSQSGIRTRRSELVAMGKVKDTGERRKLRSGRRSIVWGAQ